MMWWPKCNLIFVNQIFSWPTFIAWYETDSHANTEEELDSEGHNYWKVYSSSVPHSAPVSQVIPSCSVNTIIVTDTGDEYHDEVIDVDGDSSSMCADEFI